MVKTLPFHGKYTSSNLVKDIIQLLWGIAKLGKALAFDVRI